MKKFFIGFGVTVAFIGFWLCYLNYMCFPPKTSRAAERSAKFYAIEWLSGQTDFSKVRIDAFTLASLTTPKNGDMIEVVGYCRTASSDKIFGLSYAAVFFEIRPLDPKETAELLQRDRKDHFVLAVFKESQSRPADSNKKHSIKGVWHYPLDKKPYIEVIKIQERG